MKPKLSDVAPPLSDNEDIETLSQGEFNVRNSSYVSYPYKQQLLECCNLAIQELSNEPYLGSKSHARVMGRSMELLREDYGLDAPKGWIPVLRTLRSKAASSRITVQDTASKSASVTGSSSSFSILHKLTDTSWNELRSAMAADQAVKDCFMAECPLVSSMAEGMAYLDRVIARITASGTLPPIVARIREELLAISTVSAKPIL